MNEGIYIWAIKTDSGSDRVNYVGETSTSFYRRHKEHLIQVLGGNYQILEPAAMKSGRMEIVWNGLWRKGTRHRFSEFLSQYESLSAIIKEYVLSLKVFVAPLKVERRIRQRIEGAIAATIKKDKEASSLLPDDIRYYSSRPGKKAIVVSISADQGIDGLPPQIIVGQ